MPVQLYKKGMKTFTVSRSKIDLFISCPRCFFLEKRLGVSRPRGFPFNLNNAVDTLFKKEFDIYRKKKEPHPIMKDNGLKAVPYIHPSLETWRNTFKGVRCVHEATGFTVFGGVDDLWVNENGEVHVVDYKATSKDGQITLDAPWQITYKRQIEVYQWLLRKNGEKVSNVGYFVYANGDASKPRFDDTLHFNTTLIDYTGADDWVDGVLEDMKKTLESDKLPAAGSGCEYCPYRSNSGNAFEEFITGKNKRDIK